jgi:diguanylate cyclase (GGDEF)-like protein
VERYESLTGLASLVAGGGALSETLHAAARHVTEVLGAAWCDIYDYEVRSDEFVVAAYYDAPDVELDTSAWLGTRYDAENWPELDDCVTQRRAAVLYRDDPQLSAEQAALMDEHAELANVSVPLVSDGEVLGLLDAGESRGPRRWSDDDLRYAQAVADLAAAAVALARARADLARQAIHDELTGLFNFRHCMDRLRREVAVSRRYGLDLSLLLVDLDGFRLFNQTFGRDRGDAALVEVAGILRDVTRNEVDILARYGRDEFLIILPQTRANDPEPLTAAIVASRVHERLDAHRFESAPGQRDIAVTVSIGVAGVGLGGYTAEELLACAEKAAYLAKHAGHDRVVTFGA